MLGKELKKAEKSASKGGPKVDYDELHRHSYPYFKTLAKRPRKSFIRQALTHM
jgi:hypothetical protein